ncbi:hypothetical protein J4457_06350 [Candidatus Woesearchaeota archaeon]|nr:hypothetical protein [Candidatus Woesearchaeota archaeon]
MSKKAAIELTVNFIVTFIIAVVIFSLSLYFAVNFFRGAEEIRGSIDAETEGKIQDLLAQSGTLVAFPLNKKAGNIDDNVIYGMGILNLAERGEVSFYVKIEPHKYIDELGREDEIELAGIQYHATMLTWLKYSEGPYVTEYNDYSTVPILLQLKENMGETQGRVIPTKKGTYIFNVCVFNGEPIGDQGPKVCNNAILGDQQLYTQQIYKLYVTAK